MTTLNCCNQWLINVWLKWVWHSFSVPCMATSCNTILFSFQCELQSNSYTITKQTWTGEGTNNKRQVTSHNSSFGVVRLLVSEILILLGTWMNLSDNLLHSNQIKLFFPSNFVQPTVTHIPFDVIYIFYFTFCLYSVWSNSFLWDLNGETPPRTTVCFVHKESENKSFTAGGGTSVMN